MAENFRVVNFVILSESKPFEKRVALTPDVCKSFIDNGFSVSLESGAGEKSFFSDSLYAEKGVSIIKDKTSLLNGADVVLKINPPTDEEVKMMKAKAVSISLLHALTNRPLLETMSSQSISAFSMDAIPRISRAQKMDVLSSQANLAGYKAVILGAYHLGKIFPLLMTAAGTIKPSKVVIMGAGVAGLQAIATAKRLGAIVEVSDIRPETKEQVESLGGKFIEVPMDDSVKIEGGYVKGVSEEFLARQQAIVAKHIQEADLVITTALVPGKKAPVLIPENVVNNMKPGSVIVDMAVEQGGNCAGSVYGETILKNGVTIIGEPNIPSLLPLNASDLYAKNLQAFINHLVSKDGFKWELEEEITKGSLVVHEGKILI